MNGYKNLHQNSSPKLQNTISASLRNNCLRSFLFFRSAADNHKLF